VAAWDQAGSEGGELERDLVAVQPLEVHAGVIVLVRVIDLRCLGAG
jgi:hypothetical protein